MTAVETTSTEDLLERAKGLLLTSDRKDCTPAFFEKRLGISFLRAQDLVADLQKAGIVGPRPAQGGPFPVLLDPTVKEPHAAHSDGDADASRTKAARTSTTVTGQPVDARGREGELRSATGRLQMIRLDRLTLDPSVQPRKRLHAPTVKKYAKAMGEGASFPPIEVYRSAEAEHLADGFTRVAAAKEAGIKELLAVIYEGDVRQAFLHAITVNSHGGQPLSREEKNQAVQRLLADPEWSQWADTVVAQRCGVSNQTVGRLRKKTSASGKDRNRLYKRGGRTIRANTGNLGRKKAETANPPVTPPKQPPADSVHDQTSAEEPAAPIVSDVDRVLGELSDALDTAQDTDLIRRVLALPDGTARAKRIAATFRARADQWEAAIRVPASQQAPAAQVP